jgi:hypothetical protein
MTAQGYRTSDVSSKAELRATDIESADRDEAHRQASVRTIVERVWSVCRHGSVCRL